MKSYVKVSIAISSVLNCGKAPNTAGCLDTDVSINIFSPHIPSALPCVTIALGYSRCISFAVLQEEATIVYLPSST